MAKVTSKCSVCGQWVRGLLYRQDGSPMLFQRSGEPPGKCAACEPAQKSWDERALANSSAAQSSNTQHEHSSWASYQSRND